MTGLKKARTVGKVPVYVGIDTWAVDYALLDGKDNLIGEMYAYRDSRTNEAVRAVHSKISFEELYGRTEYSSSRLTPSTSCMRIK